MNIAIIPIRDDSTRLKNKATGFKLYKDHTPLECMIERLLYSTKIDKVIFIVPDTKENDNICNIIENQREGLYYRHGKISYFKGSTNDISGRALKAINYEDHVIINITGDCPLVDPNQIDYLLRMYELEKNEDESNDYHFHYYMTNILTRSWPDGFDIQIYDTYLLELSWRIALDKKEVTQLGWDIVNYSGYINHDFKMLNYPAMEDYFYPEWGLTLDYKEDIEVLSNIYNHFDRFDFTAEEVIDYLKANPDILKINEKCMRNIPGC